MERDGDREECSVHHVTYVCEWVSANGSHPTPKLLADIPLNKFSQKDYLLISTSGLLRVPSKIINKFKEVQRTCPTFKTLSPPTIAGIHDIF